MAEPWQKWMPLHIDRFRGSASVQAMEPACRLGYLYLLMAAWQSEDCSLPTDPLDLAELSGLGDALWAQYSARILRKFERENGRLVNPVLREEWTRARNIYLSDEADYQRTREARKKAGQIGNERRWGSQKGSFATENDRKTRFCDENPSQTDRKRSLNRDSNINNLKPPLPLLSAVEAVETAEKQKPPDECGGQGAAVAMPREACDGREEQATANATANAREAKAWALLQTQGGDARMAAAAGRVMRACGWTDARLMPVILLALGRCVDDGTHTLEDAEHRMASEWATLLRNRHYLHYRVGEKKFIQRGWWLSQAAWPWDNQRIDRAREARVGAYQGPYP